MIGDRNVFERLSHLQARMWQSPPLCETQACVKRISKVYKYMGLETFCETVVGGHRCSQMHDFYPVNTVSHVFGIRILLCYCCFKVGKKCKDMHESGDSSLVPQRHLS